MSTTTAPTVKVTGSIVALTSREGRTEYYSRDRLSTAYLLLLDAEGKENPGRMVVDCLEREHQFEHHDAMAYTIAASTLVRHNLEP